MKVTILNYKNHLSYFIKQNRKNYEIFKVLFFLFKNGQQFLKYLRMVNQ